MKMAEGCAFRAQKTFAPHVVTIGANQRYFLILNGDFEAAHCFT